MVARVPVKDEVVGSNPTAGAEILNNLFACVAGRNPGVGAEDFILNRHQTKNIRRILGIDTNFFICFFHKVILFAQYATRLAYS